MTRAALGAALLAVRAAAPVEHRVSLPSTAELEPGQDATLSLAIQPVVGRTVSRDGPLDVWLEVTPASGLELPRRHYRRAEAADPQADAPRFDLALGGRAAGDYVLSVRLRFWLCGRRTCWPVRERHEVQVKVRAPADAGATRTP